MNRDIDDGDGTGKLANAKDRESLDQNVRPRRTCERRLQGQEGGNETRHSEHRRTTDTCNDSSRVAVGRGQG